MDDFNSKLIITLVDKGLLALVAITIGYYFNKLLHKMKARDSMLEAIAEQRIKSYQTLWEITKKVQYARKTEISESDKKELGENLSEWYFKNGAAMFLSHKATKAYGAAREVIKEDSKAELREIQSTFSALRTQLKNDLKIYTEEEKVKPTINPDKLFNEKKGSMEQ